VIRGLIGWVVALLVAAGHGPAAAEPFIHHDITVTLDPAARTIEVVDAIRADGPALGMLPLPEGFVMNRIDLSDPGATLSRVEDIWTIEFRGTGRNELTVGYSGTLPSRTEAGGEGPFADLDGSLLPPGSWWYPDFGDALFSYTLAIDVPEDQRAVAPGRLVDERLADGRYRARFAFEGPAEDIAVIVGPYEVAERRHGDVLMRTYFHSEIADLADAYLAKTAAYLELHEARIGPYPFTAFHVVSSPLPVGLGLPGLTLMGTRVLRLPFILDTSLGHEVAHAWWGNGVYVDYAQGNWAEGLTTFMADYAFAEAAGEAEARAMRLRWLRDYAALPPGRDMAMRGFTGRHHGAAQIIGYHKAAMLFVMLRDEIGEPAFDEGIRWFWRKHRFRRASWRDLRHAFEETSGRHLGGLIRQWLDRVGAPRLRVRDAEATPAAVGFRAAFTLEQDEPVYALSVPVRVETEDGPRDYRVSLKAKSARFVLRVDARPVALEVDPDLRLFRRLTTEEVPPILRHLMLADRVRMIVAGDAPEVGAAAAAIARRLVEGSVEAVAAATDLPLLVIGLAEDADGALKRLGLPARPADLPGGEARMWTARLVNSAPLVVVEAASAEALAAIAHRLPHYGSKSFLVFDDGKVVEQGVWPTDARPLRIEFLP